MKHYLIAQRFDQYKGIKYIPWSVIYSFTGLMLWHGKESYDSGKIASLLIGATPLLVVGVQCLRPTVLGWLLLVVFALVYDFFLAYIELLVYSIGESHGEDSINTVIALIILALICISSTVLIITAKPKLAL